MQPRSRILRRQRRALAIGLGLSVAIHVAALAFLRIGVPGLPTEERAARADSAEHRYLRQPPLRVVRLETPPLGTDPSPAPAAAPETPAARIPARADAATPKLAHSGAALDLRPVEAAGGGLEPVALLSTASSAARSGADLAEGVVYEAASRAAREAARERGRDRRGDRGSGIGIGIGILGPGSGDCEPSLLPGGEGRIPTGIVDDFAGRFGGSGAGRRGIGGTGDGGRAGGLLGGGVRRPGGGLRVGGSGRRP